MKLSKQRAQTAIDSPVDLAEITSIINQAGEYNQSVLFQPTASSHHSKSSEPNPMESHKNQSMNTNDQAFTASTRRRINWFSEPKEFEFKQLSNTDYFVHFSSVLGSNFRTLPR